VQLKMLVSDIDGTLLGADAALRRFAEWRRAAGAGVRLVYASGRLLDSVRELTRQTCLPPPDAVIGGVGTDIHDFASGEPLRAWRRAIRRRWDAATIRAALAALDLEPQPEDAQTDVKVSYYLRDATGACLDRVRQALADAGCAASLIYSSNRDLDVVPAGADKGRAAAFLAGAWAVSPDNVIVAGDSGNDLALFEQGFYGVVVANAHPELTSLNTPRVCHARAPYADGVLEGIAHWMHHEAR